MVQQGMGTASADVFHSSICGRMESIQQLAGAVAAFTARSLTSGFAANLAPS